MKRSFYKWLDKYTDNMNDEVKEDYGIRYFFSVDSIIEDFFDSGLVEEEILDGDDFEVLKPIWEEWAKTAEPFEYTQKDIDDHIKEHKSEMRMRAMESGYHNFADDGERTYYW